MFYYVYLVLSASQKEAIQHAISLKSPLSLNLSIDQLKSFVSEKNDGLDVLPMTTRQVSMMNSTKGISGISLTFHTGQVHELDVLINGVERTTFVLSDDLKKKKIRQN